MKYRLAAVALAGSIAGGCGLPGGGIPGHAALRFEDDEVVVAHLGGPVDLLIELTVHNDGTAEDEVSLHVVDLDDEPGNDLDGEINATCPPLAPGGTCTFKVELTGAISSGDTITVVARGQNLGTVGDAASLTVSPI
jgi:hypothetical protein